MLIETDNLIPKEEFRKDLDKYVRAAQEGSGPLALTSGTEIVGFFIGRQEYEPMFGAAVNQLLRERSKGVCVAHADARARIRRVLQAHRRAHGSKA